MSTVKRASILSQYIAAAKSLAAPKILPVLYSRTATGAVQTWKVEVQGNQYRAITGQLNGQLITNKWTTCKGKNTGKANETTGEEQAFKEAQALWDKRAKTGYWEDINDIDKEAYVEPMLAHKLRDHKNKLKYPVFIQRKYNGARCMTVKGGMWSRKGEQWLTAPHIHRSLELADIFVLHPQIRIDGELYNHEWRHRLSDLMGIIRHKHIDLDLLAASQAEVKLYVYDGYGFTYKGVVMDESFPYEDRISALGEILKGIDYIEVVLTEEAKNEKEVYSKYMGYFQDGYEGAMIRVKNGQYEHKRSHTLLKVKPEDDDEFLIVDIEEGIGNRAGTAGTIVLRMNDNSNRTFGASLKGSFSQFTNIWNNKGSYIGKTVTIYYNGFTAYGIPNYARFDCNNYDKGDR